MHKLQVGKECNIEQAIKILPAAMPLFSQCGGYDMLANAKSTEITEEVNRYLDMGFTTVGPPANIYLPARTENIEAFVKALREYEQ